MAGDGEIGTATAADWLAVCREAAAAGGEVLREATSTASRSRRVGSRGHGGDLTLVIDADVEQAVLGAVERSGIGACVITEERGRVEINGGGPALVVIDPIDGSLNARRRIPHHCLSVAVALGSTMADVDFGYVHDFPNGEELWCSRGEGLFLDGERLPPLDPETELEIIGLESANPRVVAARADALASVGARRLRVVGAIALSLAYVAAARFDGMLSLYPCRSVDAAAAQLMVREVGGAVAFPDAADGALGASLELDMRSRVLAAATPALLSQLLDADVGASERP